MRAIGLSVCWLLCACTSGTAGKIEDTGDAATDIEEDSGGAGEDASEDTGNSDESDWWDDEEEDDDDDDDDGDDDDDDDKPDDEDMEDGIEFLGLIWTDAGLGFLSFGITLDGEEICTVEWSLVEFESRDDCTTCQFAWQFTLQDESIEGDADACSDATGLEGTEVAMGHGETMLGSFDGLDFYELIEEQDDEGPLEWGAVDEGYSAMTEDDDGSPLWVIGIKY